MRELAFRLLTTAYLIALDFAKVDLTFLLEFFSQVVKVRCEVQVLLDLLNLTLRLVQ